MVKTYSESQLFPEKNDTLHFKIAHFVRILQSNKQIWKWPILPLGLSSFFFLNNIVYKK